MLRYLLAAFIGFVPVAYAAPECPTTLVIIGCRVVPGNSGMEGPKGWQDLAWDISKFHLDCQREVLPLEDEAADNGATPLNHNFSKSDQCAHAAMQQASKWAEHHPGWYPIVACPAPIVNIPQGCKDESCEQIIGYEMPPCPSEIAGLPVVCREDSAI